MIASDAEITQLSDDRDHDVRRRARRTPATTDAPTAMHERNRISPVTSPMNRRVAIRGADDQADELERLGDGAGDASAALVEAELLLVQQRRER